MNCSKINKQVLIMMIVLLTVQNTSFSENNKTSIGNNTVQEKNISQINKDLISKDFEQKVKKIQNIFNSAINKPYLEYSFKNGNKDVQKEYKKTLQLSEDLVKKNPNNDLALALNAKALSYLKQNDDARMIVQKALEINPNNYLANECYGTLYSEYDKKDYNTAIKYLTKSIELNPNYDVAYINRGLAYSHLNDNKKAIEDFNNALKISPNNILALLNTAGTYKNIKNYDIAISYYDKITQIAPQYLPAQVNIINVYQLKNDLQTALTKTNELITNNPKYPDGYRVRATIYSALNMVPEALLDINRAIKQEPNNIYMYLSRLYIYTKIQASNKLVKKDLLIAENLANHDEELLEKVLHFSFSLQEFENTKRLAKKILADNPNNINALSYYANAECALGNYAEALVIYNNIGSNLSKQYYDYRAMAKLGVAGNSNTKNLIKEAISDLNQAIQANDINQQYCYYLRGTAYAIIEDYKKSLIDLNKVLEKSPNDIKILYWYGWVNLFNKNKLEALKSFAKIVELDKSQIPALINVLSLSDYADLDRNHINTAITALEQDRVLPIASIIGHSTFVIMPYIDAFGTYGELGKDFHEILPSLKYLKVMNSIANNYDITSDFNDLLACDSIMLLNYIQSLLSECSEQDILKISDSILSYMTRHPANDKYTKDSYSEIYLCIYGTKGDNALVNGDINNAISFYNMAIKYGASKYDVYSTIVSYYDNKNDYFNIIKYATIALNAKTTADMLAIRGEAKYNLRDYTGAITDLNKAIGYNPKHRSALWTRANLYFDQKKYAIAFKDYLTVSKLMPKEASAFYNMGICMYNQNKKTAALPYLEKAKNLYQNQEDTSAYNKTISLINEIKGYNRW